MGKLKKNISIETKYIEFQSNIFFSTLIGNFFFGTISYFVLVNLKDGPPILKLFGFFSIAFLVFLFFFPSVMAFDLTRQYTDKNIPTLKHPMRWVIFILNVIFGVTGIGDSDCLLGAEVARTLARRARLNHRLSQDR